MPDCVIANIVKFMGRKILVHAFDFLQACDGWPGFREPFLQPRQPRFDAIDIVGRDFHGATSARRSRAIKHLYCE